MECTRYLVKIDAHIGVAIDQLPLLVGQQVSVAHLGQVSESQVRKLVVEGRLTLSDPGFFLKNSPTVSLCLLL